MGGRVSFFRYKITPGFDFYGPPTSVERIVCLRDMLTESKRVRWLEENGLESI